LNFSGGKHSWKVLIIIIILFLIIIIIVVNKIGRSRSGSPACLITSMITDRLDDTKSCYQLIISIAKSEKEKGENVPEKE